MKTQIEHKAQFVFCGTILAHHSGKDGGVDLILDGVHERIHVASKEDKGLAFLPQGEKRHFVVEDGRIVVVYIRPRIKLLKAAGAGLEVSLRFLHRLGPVYPKSSKILRTSSTKKGTFGYKYW